MKYSQILTEHGLTADGVPVKTQGKIKTLEKLNAAIASEEADIEKITNKRAKAAAEKKVSESKDTGQLLDDEICEAIKRYVANKDHYDRQSQKLRETTANRRKKVETEPAGEPAVVLPIVETPPANEPAPVNDPPTNEPAPASVDEPPVKKKSSGIGWLLGGLVLIGLAAVGINYKRNN